MVPDTLACARLSMRTTRPERRRGSSSWAMTRSPSMAERVARAGMNISGVPGFSRITKPKPSRWASKCPLTRSIWAHGPYSPRFVRTTSPSSVSSLSIRLKPLRSAPLTRIREASSRKGSGFLAFSRRNLRIFSLRSLLSLDISQNISCFMMV